MTASTYRGDLLGTQASLVSRSRADAAGELAALHSQLVLRFRAMIDQHRPGCAFVSAQPDVGDPSPDEIVVVPFRQGAAVVSCGFVVDDRITMIVRIGNHRVVECVEDDQGVASLASRAELLLGLALSGCVQDRRYEPY